MCDNNEQKIEVTESVKEKLENNNVNLENTNTCEVIQNVNESGIAVARMNQDGKVVIKESLNG